MWKRVKVLDYLSIVFKMSLPCTSTYFDSPDFVSSVSHLITVVSTPTHIIGLYCIIMKTPDEMKSVKLYLLNLHFWIILFDYTFGILTIPFLLVPQLAGYPLGLLRYVGVPTFYQIMIVMILFNNSATSIVAVYENRFHTLCNFSWMKTWRKWRSLWLVFYTLLTFSLLIPWSFCVPEQTTAIPYVLKKLPCLPDYVVKADNFVLSLDYTYHLVACSIIIAIAFIKIAFFVLCLMINTAKQLKAKTMSQKTFRLQKKFFIALVIQLEVPILTFCIPVFYCFVAILANYYNQALTNFVVISVSMHGIVSTIVMISVHRPYRQAVFGVYKKPKVESREASMKEYIAKRNSLAPVHH
uniref:Serpentine Receptor, class H n=2 Tax=Caenorhabditis tropicalis TaxID=1561998 RepID=A0A1I7TXZ6_9PELO